MVRVYCSIDWVAAPGPTRMPAPPPPPMAEAAPPSTMPMIASMVALRSASWTRARCPPAIWPVSWATTPTSWFGRWVRTRSPV